MRGTDRRGTWATGALVHVAWLLVCAGSVLAQERDVRAVSAARQLGQDGVALYESGKYAQALDKLERAYAVVKVPTLGLWSARALDKLGKLVEASERYREVTLAKLESDASQVLRDAQTDAQREYESLAARVPQLTVVIEGATVAEVRVSIDEKTLSSALVGVAVPVNPGAHELQARRGEEVVTAKVTLHERDRREARLVFRSVDPTGAAAVPGVEAGSPDAVASSPGAAPLEARAAAASEPAVPPRDGEEGGSIAPWIVVGAGGAMAVAGGVFVVLALDAKSNVEEAAPGTPWSSVESDHDHVPTYSAVGFSLVGVGVIAVAAGLVWKYALAGNSEDALVLEATAASVSLRGEL